MIAAITKRSEGDRPVRQGPIQERTMIKCTEGGRKKRWGSGYYKAQPVLQLVLDHIAPHSVEHQVTQAGTYHILS